MSFPSPDGYSVGAFPRPDTDRPRRWLHLLLFGLTIASTTFCGGLYYGWMESPDILIRVRDPRLIIEGLKFSLPLLAILFAHEMGHLIAARTHRLRATLPFFLPMPIPFFYSPGTLGAVIKIKDPIRSRRQLLDVGAAGPIAGFVVILPVLAVGLALSRLQEIDPDLSMIYFGEPLLFRFLARSLFFPDIGPTQDIFLHPTAWAAWFGLFVTALNLLPFSQLDGGHIGYALLGRWHRILAWPLLVVLVLLGFLWVGWWVWSAIFLVLKPHHPRVLDEHRPLDERRQRIGWLSFLIFALCFTPVPITIAP